MRTIWAFLIAFPLLLSAATTDVVVTTSDGRTTHIDAPDPAAVDVIVQFRDTPLFAQPQVQSSADRSKANKAFDARFAQFANDIRAVAPHITHTYRGVFAGASVTVPRAAIPQIARLSYVRAVYPDGTVRALADDGVTKIHANEVWTTFGTRGEGVVVAVIDTGIDYTHPALGGSFGPHARVIGGWDFVNKDSDPMDDNGHGTHVAGIIGADGGGLTGVAPGVSFLAYKVLSDRGSGKDSDVIAAVERATDPNQDGVPTDHADVVNMSLGGPGDENAPLPQAVDTATAAGVVFCIAAGNSGGFYTVGSPAVALSAISVGASDLKDKIAFFSSGGPSGTLLALKPEVVAPGVDIVSAAPGGGTIAHSGTSMAAPHVAGVAALVKSLHRDWSPADIKSAIVTTAEDLHADVMSQGAGRVDALRAAAADVVVSPAAISFGRDDSTSNRWAVAYNPAVTNRSDHPLTLTVSVTGTIPGVTVTVQPATLTLAPGDTQPLLLNLVVDNTLLPYPKEGSLTLSGRIVIAGGASTLNVPWAFVKCARITAHYEGSDDVQMLMVVGTGGSKTAVQSSVDPGTLSANAYVPPGIYAVQMNGVSFGADGILFRYMFLDRDRVEESSSYTFRSAMAPNVVTIASTDDEGRLLGDIGRDPGVCHLTSFMTYASDTPLTWISFGISTQSGAKLRVAASPRPQGISLTESEACWDGASSVYVAQHGDLPADGSTLSVDPSTWMRVPLKLIVPAGLDRPFLNFGPAIFTRTPLFASTSYWYETFPVSDAAWTGTLFITPEKDPVVTTGAGLQLLAFQSPSQNPVVDSYVMRGFGSGVGLLRYRTAGPTTYIGRPGEPLLFGGPPVHPESSVLVANRSLLAVAKWIGPLDEKQTPDASATTVVRDSAGEPIGTGDMTTLPSDGVYAVDFINGSGALTARFDSRRSDSAPPSLRSLRIVDETGRATATVLRNSHAMFRFAAIDVQFAADPPVLTYALVKSDKTTVAWRPRGSTAWLPLNVTLEASELANNPAELASLGHQPAGSVFASDLLNATQSVGDVDLRLHVEDESGNSIEYVLSPAFAVTPDARRRAVKP